MTHNTSAYKHITRRGKLLLGVLLIMMICASGCHADDSQRSTPAMEDASAESDVYMSKMSGMGNGLNVGASADYAADSLTSESDSSSSALSESELGAAAAESDAADISRKLIRTVNISAQTTAFDAVNESINSNVSAFGGYLENSSVYGNSYYGDNSRYANYTIRIPADKLNAFLDKALDGLRVVSRSEDVEDITLRYTDLESRVKALETEQDRLYELMSKADSVDAIISIETRLSEIRYELESIQSSLRVYDNQVVYSTVYLYIEEVKITSTSPESSFLEKVGTGLSQNLLSLKENAEAVVIAFISSLPTIIVCAALFAIVFLAVRKICRIVRKRKRGDNAQDDGDKTNDAKREEKTANQKSANSDKLTG